MTKKLGYFCGRLVAVRVGLEVAGYIFLCRVLVGF